MSWLKRKGERANPAGEQPGGPGSIRDADTVDIRVPTGDVVALGSPVVVGGVVVTISQIQYAEPPLRITRSAPGARWLFAGVRVSNVTKEKKRMPAFEVMCFDGAYGDRELCQEPEDFDTLHWLGEESMIESIIFFSVPGKAGGVIEAQAQGVDGEGARSARWRLPA